MTRVHGISILRVRCRSGQTSQGCQREIEMDAPIVHESIAKEKGRRSIREKKVWKKIRSGLRPTLARPQRATLRMANRAPA